mgnify:CR=1 FL=1
MAATEEALTDANWKPQENSDRERTVINQSINQSISILPII